MDKLENYTIKLRIKYISLENQMDNTVILYIFVNFAYNSIPFKNSKHN